ncbi:MAG: hypothetical protein AABW72_03810 [archaeon]|mgnify:CR=1 FL=1
MAQEKRAPVITYEFIRKVQGLLEANLQRMPATEINYIAHSQALSQQLGQEQKRVLDALHEAFPLYGLITEKKSPKELADAFLSRNPKFRNRLKLENLAARIKRQGGLGGSTVMELAKSNGVHSGELATALKEAGVTYDAQKPKSHGKLKMRPIPISSEDLRKAREKRQENAVTPKQRYEALIGFIRESVHNGQEIANKELFMKVTAEVFRATKAQTIARRFGIDELAVIAVRNRLNSYLTIPYLRNHLPAGARPTNISSFRGTMLAATRFYDTYTEDWASADNREYAKGKGTVMQLKKISSALAAALDKAFKNKPVKVQTITRTRRAVPIKAVRPRTSRRMP